MCLESSGQAEGVGGEMLQKILNSVAEQDHVEPGLKTSRVIRHCQFGVFEILCLLALSFVKIVQLFLV